MSVAVEFDLEKYCAHVAARAKRAAARLANVPSSVKDAWLRQAAKRLRERTAEVEAANARDVAAGPGYGLSEAQIDRLRLTPQRIEDIAAGLEQVADLPDPVGAEISTSRPARISGQPCNCGPVGLPKRRSNHSAISGSKPERGMAAGPL